MLLPSILSMQLTQPAGIPHASSDTHAGAPKEATVSKIFIAFGRACSCIGPRGQYGTVLIGSTLFRQIDGSQGHQLKSRRAWDFPYLDPSFCDAITQQR